MFLLNSRIPLVRFSSESIAAGVSERPHPGSPIQIHFRSSFLVPLSVAATITQSSEPILFPKLRIYFAEFPYLHYSIDQRLLTLET